MCDSDNYECPWKVGDLVKFWPTGIGSSSNSKNSELQPEQEVRIEQIKDKKLLYFKNSIEPLRWDQFSLVKENPWATPKRAFIYLGMGVLKLLGWILKLMGTCIKVIWIYDTGVTRMQMGLPPLSPSGKQLDLSGSPTPPENKKRK